MKKIVMTLVALMAMTAAQAQNTNTQCEQNCKDQKECCDKKDGKDCCQNKDGKDCDKKCDKNCCGKKGGKFMMGKGMNAERQTEMMCKRLNLTDEQKAKVQALNAKRAADFKKKAELKKEQKADKKQQIQEERKAYDEEMKQILNEEQYKEYQQMCQNFKRQGRGHHHGKKGFGPKHHRHGHGQHHCDSIPQKK